MNSSPILYWTTFSSALGSGLMAGVFFAFSAFVMNALARLPAAQGIAAMQSINLTVINPWFMSVFTGTAFTCGMVLVASLVNSSLPNSGLLIAACLFYLAGTVLVTGIANVPLNDALAVVMPDSAESARLWSDYLKTWAHWNHVRTVSSFSASALFSVALNLSSKS